MLSIALLLADTAINTTGLDSSTALSIVTLLNQLARGGMIVICSIHQPRANIFSQFDKVMLPVTILLDTTSTDRAACINSCSCAIILNANC